MTLSAFAAVELAHANPKAINAAISKGTSDWRIDIPTQFRGPQRAAPSIYSDQGHFAKPYPRLEPDVQTGW
jgi:hypothetical protein